MSLRHLILALASTALLLLTASLFWTSLRGTSAESRLLDELRSIEARAEPVLPGDLLASMPAGDPATRAWLEEYEALPESWTVSIVRGDVSPEEVGDAASQARSAPGARALAKAWADCLRDDPAAAQWLDLEWIEGLLDSQPNPASLSECERRALSIWFDVSGASCEWALRAEGLGAIDQVGPIQAMLDTEVVGITYPVFPMPALLGACRILLEAASIAALEGDTARLLDHLSRALHVADMARGQAWCHGHMTYEEAMSQVLRGVERSLAYLPSGADISFVEEYLLAWDPRADMRAALLGERAFVTFIIERIRAGAYGQRGDEFLVGPGFSSRPPSALELTLEQLAYLEAMEVILAEQNEERFDRSRTAEREVEEILAVRPGSRLLPIFVMSASEMHQAALGLDVRRRMALHALHAHRDGIESTVHAIEQDVDPFSGEALRVRVDPDGSWILWSTGPDATDDGGAWEQDMYDPNDIVWRHRALPQDR